MLTKLESAHVQFPPHAEIARQAVERIAERGGLVVFEAEVPDPRKGVSGKERSQQPEWFARDDERRVVRSDGDIIR